MTPKQRERYENLRDKVKQAYIAWDKNTDRNKDEELHSKWLKALERCEAFEEKYL